jgi:two-component system response regulator PilR (NtrC family)
LKLSLQQADAIEELLESPHERTSLSELGQTTLSCADRLIDQGEFDRALQILERYERAAKQDISPLIRTRAGLARGRALLYSWRATEAREALALAKQWAEQDPTGLELERQLIAVYLAGSQWRQNQFDLAIHDLTELRREFSSRPDGVATCVCAVELAAAYSQSGNWVAARDAANESLVAARRIQSEHWQAIALCNIGIIERFVCRWMASNEALNRALQYFERQGSDRFVWTCNQSLGIITWKRGRLLEALASAEQLMAAARSAGSKASVDHLFAVLLHCRVLTHLGRFAAAEAALLSSEFEGVEGLPLRAELLATEYLGDIFLERNRMEDALREYSKIRRQAGARIPSGDISAESWHRLAECRLKLGESQLALELAQEGLAACKQIGEVYEEAAAHRVLAMAQAALGMNDACSSTFEAGFTRFEELQTPYEWAKLWVAYGDWTSSDGAGSYRNLSAAHDAYRAAIDHFERIGAEYKLGEARARLESLNERMRLEGEAYSLGEGKVRPARRPRYRAEVLRRSQWALDTFGLVTRSAPLLAMLEEIASVAVSELPVLVLGESGTGKELVARAVHELSGRTGEFMAINCSAVPEAMLEGEFFGYMRGAFTNAVADKPGLFEVAHGGTVFLDEIGEMSPDLQSKLLRLLETGTLRRVGATRDQQIDARIVAATNRERSQLSSGTGFRSDLYYRLAHAVYELPPLRQRGDDVELLVDHFLEQFLRTSGKRTTLTPAVRARLIKYSWPGNVRQLASVIQKLVVSARTDAPITPRDLPPLEEAADSADFAAETQAGEKRRILRALEQANYIKTDAAEILRVSRTTLLSKMKRLGIEG